MIVTTLCHNRVNFLRIMLAGLKEAERHSPEKVELKLFKHNCDFKIPEIANEFDGHTIDNLTSPDCHRTYVDMVSKVFRETDAQYMLHIDSDMCVHPDLLLVVQKAIKDLPDFGAVGFFNEDVHPEPSARYLGEYHIKEHYSFCSILIRREAWEAFIPPADGAPFDFGCVDGMFTTSVSKNSDFNLYCTVRSYVDHLPHGGAHTGESPDGIVIGVRARRFHS